MKMYLKMTTVLLGLIFASSPFSLKAADKSDKEKLKPYVLQKCIVSDEKLGEMGKPVVEKYKGREIKFCCKSCIKDFKKDPEKYVKLIESAETKARKDPVK